MPITYFSTCPRLNELADNKYFETKVRARWAVLLGGLA
jgi:hypothetical protein